MKIKRLNEDYLAHHGIKGQKWGVRRYQNADGSLTAAGRNHYGYGPIKDKPADVKVVNKNGKTIIVDGNGNKIPTVNVLQGEGVMYNKPVSQKQIDKVRKIVKKSKWDEDVSEKVFDAVKADKTKLKSAVDEMQKNYELQKSISDKSDELYKELDNKSTETYYAAVSEIANSMQYKKDPTMEDIGWSSYMGLFEDGQQGRINAYSMYTSKNGLEKKVSSMDAEAQKASKKYEESAENYISTALEEVGGKKLKDLTIDDSSSYKITKSLVSGLRTSIDTPYTYKVSDGSYALGFTDSDKKNISIAENIAKNIKNNTNKNTWWYLFDAVEELGYSDKKASEMTNADWNKLNEKIEKIDKATLIKPS